MHSEGKRKVLRGKGLKTSNLQANMITRVHLNHRALGFVLDLRGNMKIIGNCAHIFVVPAQIYSDN